MHIRLLYNALQTKSVILAVFFCQFVYLPSLPFLSWKYIFTNGGELMGQNRIKKFILLLIFKNVWQSFHLFDDSFFLAK